MAKRRTRSVLHNRGLVTAVAFSPDGLTLAAAGHSQFVTTWDVSSGLKIRELDAHLEAAHVTGYYDGVNCLAFSLDGRFLAWAVGTGGGAPTRLFDLLAGRELPGGPVFDSSVISLAFSPDRRMLAAGDFHGNVKLWETPSGRLVSTFRGYSGNFSSLAFSADGRTLACSGSIPRIGITLFDVTGGREPTLLGGYQQASGCMAYSSAGDSLARGHADGIVKLWDAATGRTRASLKAHSSWVSSVAFSPNGKALATTGWDGAVKLWDVAALAVGQVE